MYGGAGVEKRKLHMNMYLKILLLCTSSILAALILMAALFAYSNAGTIYEQSKQTNIQLLQRLQDDITTKVKKYEETLISVYNEEDLMYDLTMHLDYSRMRKDHFREAYLMAQNFGVEDGIVAIYFYDDFDRLISSYRHASTPVYRYPEDPLSDSDCNGKVLRAFLKSDSATMLVSSYYNENRQTDIVRFAINIFSQDGRRNQIGAVVCDVDSAVFLESLEKYEIQSGNLLWLQPTEDRVAVGLGLGGSALAEQITEAVRGGRSEEELRDLVTGQVLFCLPLEPYNLTLYSLMPPTLLVENQKAVTRSLLTIAVLMVVVFAFVSMLVARGITRPLAALTGTMRRIQSGQTELRVEKLGSDEIGELGLTFNQMLDQVETLLVQEYQMKLSLQKAQHNALQAQINPHFLYNTLDTMSSIAQIQGCEEVSDLSESLSRIFRYSLDMRNFATVEQELIHLKNYIYVMDVRLHNEIRYIFDVEESALNCRIPRLTLQPIVENVIQHGVRGVRHEKIIRLNVRRQEEMLVITISDNGVGMDPTAIRERLRRNDREEIEKGRSIGLVNVNARIRILYGDDCGVAVDSAPGEGTVVTVKMPAREEMAEYEL